MKNIFKFAVPLFQASLIKQIIVGLILGFLAGYFFPQYGSNIGFLGTVFVSALKAVAPILVFILVMSAIANQDIEGEIHIKPIIVLYLISTFAAAAAAVVASFLWPTFLHLQESANVTPTTKAVTDVFRTLVLNIVDNPVHALATANYVGILAWAIALGVVMRKGSQSIRDSLNDLAIGVEYVVKLVIRFAPFGIFGIVTSTVATNGVAVFGSYLHLLALLLGTMLFSALVINPILVFLATRKNPFPLVLMCLKDSGVNAFFTRSSAANVTVNMDICRRMKLPESTYGISIPVGATINMAGAAITITVLTMAAAHTFGIQISLVSAIFLSFIAGLCACGASGVPGGSLLLIPLACGLFGIDQQSALEVVAVGFIIGVIQDSAETALNSSSDVLFTIAACHRAERLHQAMPGSDVVAANKADAKDAA